MVTKILQLGDKVDIHIEQQEAREANMGNYSHVYKSQVNDIMQDGSIEITMPIENSKVILLPLGQRFKFVFYTSSGLYYSSGQIRERYKRENIFILLVDLHTQMEKFQRREYYRYSCLMEINYFVISGEDAKVLSPERILSNLREKQVFDKNIRQAMLLDLSGGGARFAGEEKLEMDSYVLMIFRLSSGSMDKQYFLKGHVLASGGSENSWGKTESRVQFIFYDNRVQEEIIQYIFEEERRTRRRSDAKIF